MDEVFEPARRIPVAAEVDVCVIGGGCTGAMAAVAAARCGVRVAVVENNGFFGGVATAGLVSIWHSLMDDRCEKPIIAGLHKEVLDGLRRRKAVMDIPGGFVLNTPQLMIELDELVRSADVQPFLHTRFVAPVMENGRIMAAIIEDKTGRRAIRARQFIDASGDGDLLARAGFTFTLRDNLQPPTAAMVVSGLEELDRQNSKFELSKFVFAPKFGDDLAYKYLWHAPVMGVPGMKTICGTRVSNANCADADQLTAAEIEARRQARVICDRLRTYDGGESLSLVNLSSYIGVRETRHARCLYSVTTDDLLYGRRFDDAIANGTYPLDVHHSDKPGITMRHLDGSESYHCEGKVTVGRWRPEGEPCATFYQIPYRCLVPQGSTNLLVAGRLIDADRSAYGAIRVMINCNQTGHAVGLAAALAIQNNCSVSDIDISKLRRALQSQNAIIL